ELQDKSERTKRSLPGRSSSEVWFADCHSSSDQLHRAVKSMPPRIARDRNDGIGASAAFPPFAHLLHKPHLNYVGAVYDRAVLFEIDELRAVIDHAYS